MLTRYSKLKQGQSIGYDGLKLTIESLELDRSAPDMITYTKPLREAMDQIEYDILNLIEDLEISEENLESYRRSYQ